MGCYMSTDMGVSWTYLCGQPSYYSQFNTRFFVRGSYIYLPAYDSVAGTSDLWMLNLDSMENFTSSINEQFINGMKRDTVSPGAVVTVNYQPQTDTLIGVDSIHISIHYNSGSLTLEGMNFPVGWSILDSSSKNGILDLWLADTAYYTLPTPILQLTFNTYLSPSPAKVYLDSALFYGKRLNCDYAALSIAGSDSVEIDFNLGCGDSLILAAMNDAPPFSIVSIQPNPASSSIEINLSKTSPVTYSLFDALGHSVLSGTDVPSKLDVTSLPNGGYYIRLNSNGYVQTRKIEVER